MSERGTGHIVTIGSLAAKMGVPERVAYCTAKFGQLGLEVALDLAMTALSGGTLLKILKQAGESAALGEPIAIIGQPGEDIAALFERELHGDQRPEDAPLAPPAARTSSALLQRVARIATRRLQRRNDSLQPAEGLESFQCLGVGCRHHPDD
mgnify:CR=1 FL=1